ncbi:MAG TPA: alpha-E domain-containing protein [Candidatus Binataceae bacterium]|nr:alpha-E domain-containing protein [Candidatus Binataceae bacterium]
MLRRIAGSLYWAARYLERAQWRARLVDVNYNLLLEVPPRHPEPWGPLLQITAEQELFASLHEKVTEAAIIEFFVFEKQNPSSIRSCIEAVRNNLSPLRHLISSELWVAVNRLYLECPEWSAQSLAASGVSSFFADLQRDFYTIEGIIDNTMPRDLAYDLMEIGTMLERPDNVSRLLDVKYHYLLPKLEDIGGPADMRQWAAVLRSASAFEAFRKVYGHAIRVNRVVEILVFDPAFPRSMRFCIERLAHVLARIGQEEEQAVCETSPCADLLAMLRNGTAEQTILDGLHEFLIRIENMCARIGEQVFDRYMSLE